MQFSRVNRNSAHHNRLSLFDHPKIIRLSLSFSFSLFLQLSLFLPLFSSRLSTSFPIPFLFKFIGKLLHEYSQPARYRRALHPFAAHSFLSPWFSINSEFYLVRSAVPSFRVFIPTRCNRAKVYEKSRSLYFEKIPRL